MFTYAQTGHRWEIENLKLPNQYNLSLFQMIEWEKEKFSFNHFWFRQLHETENFLPYFPPFKETTLERADFKAGWSELSWSGRALSILAFKITGTTADKNWRARKL